MKTNNTSLKNFVNITLKSNLDNNFTLKGNSIVNIMKRMLKEEQSIVISSMLSLIHEEIEKANYNSFMVQWKGLNLEEAVYEKLKEKLLLEIEEKLKKV